MSFLSGINLLLALFPLVERFASPHGPKPVTVTEAHYRVYDAKGNPATLEQVLERMRDVDIIFLGEHHDDPVAHHLQLRLLTLAREQRAKQPSATPPRPLALALEMFERDVQHVIDEYLSGLITEQHFLASARPWNNYRNDYRPLVEYAREHKLAVIASNAPRRYVNRVGRLGAASLKEVPDPLGRGLPPLPYGEASPAYAAKFNDLMKKGHTPAEKKADEKKPAAGPTHGTHPHAKPDDKKPAANPHHKAPPTHPAVPKADEKKPAAHDSARGLEAQSLWDATMAYSIAEHLLRSPRSQVVHVNGGFHSEKRMGVPDHLLRYRPGTTFVVVTMVSHKGFPKFDVDDLADRGDFVVVTDPSLPRSFSSRPPERK